MLALLALTVVAALALFAKYARHLNGLGSPRVLYNFVIVSVAFTYFEINWPTEILEFFAA